MTPLGYAWLIQHLHLPERSLAVTSQLGARLRTIQQPDGSIQHYYPPHYAPEPSLIGHLEFALKHNGVDLCLLRDIFHACGPTTIEAAIAARPTGKYARLLGFYYELTTGRALNPALAVGGNAIAALSAEDYLVSPTPRRNRRWRVLDNLLGDERFCPLVRRTPAIVTGMTSPLQVELQALIADFPPALLQRASATNLRRDNPTLGAPASSPASGHQRQSTAGRMPALPGKPLCGQPAKRPGLSGYPGVVAASPVREPARSYAQRRR